MLRQYHDGSRQSAHPAKSKHRTMSEPSATQSAPFGISLIVNGDFT
jgi:hypothetical protein